MLVKSILLTGLAAVAAAHSSVMDLMPSNFDKIVVESGKPTLVEFFAPWCGHCKNLAPIYEELAIAFAHAKDKVQIAKVDADAEKSLGSRFGIQGFPTLKWFDGTSDTPADYKSGRDFDSLAGFITEKTGVKPRKKAVAPSLVEFPTDATFSELVGADKHVLVAFTAPWCGHCKTLAPIWETLAEDFRNEPNVVIAKVDAEAENCKATAEAEGVHQYPTIKLFRAGSTKGELYEGGRQEKDLIEYLNKEVGTHRVPGGGLDGLAGTIEAFDAFIAKLVSGTKLETVAADIAKVAEEFKDDMDARWAKYYARVVTKLGENREWVHKELARLEGILAKGVVAPTKADEIKSKTNILKKFAGSDEAAAKEETAAKDDAAGKDEL